MDIRITALEKGNIRSLVPDDEAAINKRLDWAEQIKLADLSRRVFQYPLFKYQRKCVRHG